VNRFETKAEAPLNSKSIGEPVAPVGNPPAQGEDGESGDDGPDKGECEVCDETERGKEEPKDFALHAKSLAQVISTLGFFGPR
jgi:hypothetical protein